MLTRRRFAQLAALTAGAHAIPAQSPADITLNIAPYLLEASPKHRIKTIAYNGQVPGPLLRLKQNHPVTVEVTNHTADPEIVHWHGLFLPPETDGAMEEGTPGIAPGATTRFTINPDPGGLRWYHTHTFAGNNLSKAQYTGQHGFLLIDPPSNPARYDQEFFLALHDWDGHFASSDDGFMSPLYGVSTINGKMLGSGEPLRVREGDRVLLHILNSSPTEVHWIALAGHTLQVLALDGNPVPTPRSVPMLRLAPAERISCLVHLNSPGTWILGEVRKHIQAAGMGIVLEYAHAYGNSAPSAKPLWRQPTSLVWNYRQFAATSPATPSEDPPKIITLAFDSKFRGHGTEEAWLIKGRSYPDTEEPILESGQRYRLILKNLSADDHPLHLHRHTFELLQIDDTTPPSPAEIRGIHKDVVLVPSKSTAILEFLANHPGRTLFHCHQQDHMDRGFMMVFRYA